MEKIVRFLVCSLLIFFNQLVSAQATLPLSRTAFCSTTPTGWTDASGGGCYNTSFACSGSNGGRLDGTGDYYQVFFNSSPGTVDYTIKSTGSSSSSLLVEESPDGTTWTTVNNHTSIPTTCTSYSFSLICSSRYVRWTYTKVTNNITFDDITISAFSSVAEDCTDGIDNDCDGLIDGADSDCAGCVAATSPTTPPSSPVTLAGCNGLELCWANGDGSSRLVVLRSGSAVASSPSDQTTYTANSIFGSGNTTGPLDYVVFNGTDNCVTITGLDPSTTYYYSIFEYNGNACEENYLTSSVLSGTIATSSCDNCPAITSLLINSCAASPCGEGDNEIIFLNTRDYYVTPSTADMEVYYGNTNPPTTNYLNSFASNPTATTTMNTSASCGTVFIDASTVSTIPPNSSVMIVKDGTCTADYFDWNSLCGYGPVYVFYSTDTDWNSSGNFVNSDNTNPTLRYLRTVIEGCTTDYEYDGSVLNNSDGEYVTYGFAGGAPSSYADDDCSLPPAVLPVELLEFTGKQAGSGNLLQWTTLSESQTDYFEIEKSYDGIHFFTLEKIKAAGNTSIQLNYQTMDDTPGNRIVYYRLAVISSDHSEYNSRTIAVYSGKNSKAEIHDNGHALEISVPHSDAELNIISNDGRSVYNMKNINENISIDKSRFVSGIYVLTIRFNDEYIVRKFIVQN